MPGPQVGIPIVAVVDTNCDPDETIIPETTTLCAIRLITSTIANAVQEGRQGKIPRLRPSLKSRNRKKSNRNNKMGGHSGPPITG